MFLKCRNNDSQNHEMITATNLSYKNNIQYVNLHTHNNI